MPMTLTRSVGRESCRGTLDSGNADCASRGSFAGAWRSWTPATVQAAADARGLEVAEFLCRGCLRRFTRLGGS